MNANRTIEVVAPRRLLRSEHTFFLVSLNLLTFTSINYSRGYMFFPWMLVQLVVIALLFYSGLLGRGAFQKL